MTFIASSRTTTEDELKSTNGSGTLATGTTLTYTLTPLKARNVYTLMTFIYDRCKNSDLYPKVM